MARGLTKDVYELPLPVLSVTILAAAARAQTVGSRRGSLSAPQSRDASFRVRAVALCTTPRCPAEMHVLLLCGRQRRPNGGRRAQIASTC